MHLLQWLASPRLMRADCPEIGGREEGKGEPEPRFSFSTPTTVVPVRSTLDPPVRSASRRRLSRELLTRCTPFYILCAGNASEFSNGNTAPERGPPTSFSTDLPDSRQVRRSQRRGRSNALPTKGKIERTCWNRAMTS